MNLARANWFFHACGDIAAPGLLVDEMVVEVKSDYQQIRVIQNAAFGRVLVLDDDPQTSSADHLQYHEPLVIPALLYCEPRTVFIAGGGDGGAAGCMLAAPMVDHITLAEIDPMIPDVCVKALKIDHGAFSSPKLSLAIGDASKTLALSSAKFDCIVSDLSTEDANPLASPCFSDAFFQLVHEHLSDEGIFVTQAHSTNFLHSSRFRHLRRSLSELFPVVWCYHAFVPLFCTTWGFLMCSKRAMLAPPTQSEIQSRLDRLGVRLVFHDPLSLAAMFAIPRSIID